MPRFIALYRGINVGGKNSVKMESLRALHERLGHRAVRSYIQSGNIVFQASGGATSIARKLATEFAHEFDFAPKLIVVEGERWAAIVKANPYAKIAAAKPQTVHLALGDGEPNEKALGALLTKTGSRETFELGQGVIYLHAPDGFGTSKFAAGMEKASGVSFTVRNWRTIEALGKLLEATP